MVFKKIFLLFKCAAVIGGLSSLPKASAECKDLILRMQDTKVSPKGAAQSGLQQTARELTMHLNCHEGSYAIPSATTINVFEWKDGRLCHAHRVCGNVKYWNGHFGVVGLWSWGQSLTDFTSNSRTVRQFQKLSDGSLAGHGGDAVANATSSVANSQSCVNASDPQVQVYKISSNAIRNSNGGVSADGFASGRGGDASLVQATDGQIDQNGFCVDKIQVNALWNNRNVRVYGNDYPDLASAVGGVYGSQLRDQMNGALQKDGRWMCFQKGHLNQSLQGTVTGGQGAMASGGAAIGGYNYSPISDVFAAGNLQTIQACARDVSTQISAPSNATASGGDGGNGYAPVFGVNGGRTNADGSVDTDFSNQALRVDFALDFGQIERYCSPIREENCF